MNVHVFICVSTIYAASHSLLCVSAQHCIGALLSDLSMAATDIDYIWQDREIRFDVPFM
jgi:hypothetical protein